MGQFIIAKELSHGINIKGVPHGLRLQAHEFSASYLEQEAMYYNQNRYPRRQEFVVVAHDDKSGVLQTSSSLVRFSSFDANSLHAPATALRFIRDSEEPWNSSPWHSDLAKSTISEDVHDDKTIAPCKVNGIVFEDFMRFCRIGRLPCFLLYENAGQNTALIYGRLAKSSSFKRHWMRVSRAVILVKGELHLVFECMKLCLESTLASLSIMNLGSTTFPSYWADETIRPQKRANYTTQRMSNSYL